MDKKLYEYAQLLVLKGVNIQKGQTLVISSPIECAYFARMCMDIAYEAGCREVVMSWRDDYVTRQRYLLADDAVFDEVPEHIPAFNNGYAKSGAAFLSITASDPENLKGVDPSRIKRNQRAVGKALAEYRELTGSNAVQWCIGAVPIPAWAMKVFPDLSEDEAMSALWEKIFTAVRVHGDMQAITRWQEHIERTTRRKQRLNDYRFKYLKYKNSIGTDLTVELPEGHFFEGVSEHSKSGIVFSPNIPTEELFTVPHRLGVNGTVVSAMPLVYNGTIIEDFKFTFKDGKIIEVSAKRGEEVLRDAIAADEGASYLGEVALVPYDSPIKQAGVLFYNTLYDENASCHFAFGSAYPCIEGADKLSSDELFERGVNRSITHVDFMIGTSDMSIVGITHDGKEVPVFVDGLFAF